MQSAFKKHARGGKFKGGDVWVCPPDDTRTGFIYMATQPDMYHATLPYLRKAVRKLAGWASVNHAASVALPKIGAGLGKLSWSEEVKPLLCKYLEGGSTDFVVYETFRNELEGGA